ncbi:unnamed protein product, partial [Ectocarpus sp. 12 AP-2014]
CEGSLVLFSSNIAQEAVESGNTSASSCISAKKYTRHPATCASGKRCGVLNLHSLPCREHTGRQTRERRDRSDRKCGRRRVRQYSYCQLTSTGHGDSTTMAAESRDAAAAAAKLALKMGSGAADTIVLMADLGEEFPYLGSVLKTLTAIRETVEDVKKTRRSFRLCIGSART